MKELRNTTPKHSSITGEKHPLLHIAWTKWINGCSEEELVKWIKSLSREENIRLGEEIMCLIDKECQKRKIDKHYESHGIQSEKPPIFLRGLIETCDFKVNKANQDFEKKGK